jgi:hypothetical protein
MNASIKEVLSAAERDARWFRDTALFFEEFAAKLKAEEKAEWDLLATVYRERAQAIQTRTEILRQKLAAGDSSEAGLENA